MATIVIILVVVSGITNMVADVFLVSGKDHKINNQPMIDVARNTPDKHIKLSGMIGLISLSFWLSVLYYLSYLKGNIGIITMISYAVYIGCIMVFHVVCSYIFLLGKHTEMSEKSLNKIFIFYAGACVVSSTLYSGLMLYLGISGILKINFIQYITLPLFSTIIVQFILGNLIKIKYFSSVSGTLGMIISMLSTISIIAGNFNVF